VGTKTTNSAALPEREPPQPQQQQGRPLRYLSPRIVQAIEDALSTVGPFGQVRLVMSRGKLRYIETTQSHDLGPPE